MLRDNGKNFFLYIPMNSKDWESLYFKNLPRVYNFFRYRVGDGAVAEDLTSETFAKAWNNRHRYDQKKAGFYTWLLAIARNVSIDYFRRQQNQTRIDEMNSESISTSVEESVEHSIDLSLLTKLLEGLSEQEKEIVALKYGSGMTNKDIAHLIGFSETNVGTILHRSVKKLRERWEAMS